MTARVQAIRGAFGCPAYARYMSGNSVSLVGTWVQRLAVGWLAWQLTHSPAWVGFISFSDLFATVLIGPFGGVIADRYPRRMLLLLGQSLLAPLSVLTGTLIAFDQLGILGLAALAGLQGAIIGINQPARLAFVPALVPREHLATAVALNSVLFNSARFIGPLVASVIIANFGIAAAFYFNALTFMAFIMALVSLDVDDRPSTRPRMSWTAELTEGVVHVARHPALGPLLLAFIVSSLLVRPLAELLPAIAAQLFHGDVHTLAYLSSALGVGAVIGGIWLAGAQAESLLRSCLLAMLFSTIAAVVTVLSPSLVLALPALAVGGFFLVSAGVGAQTLAQLGVPQNLRGRVLSLFGLVFRGGPALGALVLGLLAEGWGLRWTLTAGGVLFTVFWLWLYKDRGRMEAGLADASRSTQLTRDD